MYKIILLTLFAAASANVTVNSTCPVFKTSDNFDFNAFSQGKWYEYANYPIFDLNTKCNYWDYTLEGESAKGVAYAYVDGKLNSREVVFKPFPGVIGKLIYNVPSGPSYINKIDFIYNVLASDNRNYVIGYICNYDEKKNLRVDFTWIYTRSKTPTKEIETAIDNAITSLGFLDKSKFIKTDFTDEICKNV